MTRRQIGLATLLAPLLGAVPAGAAAETLATAIEALPDDVAAYKQLDGVRPALSAWLTEFVGESADAASPPT